MTYLNASFGLKAKQPIIISGLALVAAACIGERLARRLVGSRKAIYESSPGKTTIPALSKAEIEGLPYHPESLPGGRDVDTPYGSIRVYEWGPEGGERVLFVHGISTPAVALGDLAHEMARRGCRVMIFDLFGRGYSDAPRDATYDERLYTSQILLVLASSTTPWMDKSGFHLVGYSLGGALSVMFTRYFPHHVRSLSLIAPGGLIRRNHIGWQSWLYYSSGLLPEFLVKPLVARRIRPAGKAKGKPVDRDGDVNGGEEFDGAVISKTRPHVTVSEVVAWQVDHHRGFVPAFLSTIRNAPIYAPQDHWAMLSNILETRQSGRRIHANDAESAAGLEGGKILVILGKDDGLIILNETVEDIYAVLGRDGVEIDILEGGHEIAITSSTSIAESIERFWESK
ncbi:alpha/beta-hydrolase [Xylaria cf. heliscus]|nr:alpha/beta-hydrolase [Xylaria cf. heliscus]